MFYLLIILITSCKKENQPPICMIQNPPDNSEFLRGDSIKISVEASDPDGLIRQVSLYMDEVNLTTITRLPYAYKFETSDFIAGQHLLKASAIDVEGLESSDFRNITIRSILLVLTSIITDIRETSAQSGGIVKDDEGSEVTARGVCWSTSPGPTLADNSLETKYGMEYSFKTYTGSVTDYDGNVYETIQIGSQNWMGENLKNTHYANGTEIPLVEDLWPGSGGHSYCWYENDISNKDIYGALYKWSHVYGYSIDLTDEYRICPAGWHVPSDTEWSQLSNYPGGPDLAGGKLKGTGTSSKNSYTSAFHRFIGSGHAGVFRAESENGSYYSIRCVQD